MQRSSRRNFKMARHKKSKFNLGQKILIILKASVELNFCVLADLVDLFAYHSERWGFNAKEELYTIQAMAKALERLRDEGLIEENDKKDKKTLHLTHKGELSINWLTPYLKKPEGRWDGKWYVVIFDIPEGIKNARNLLRRKLRDLGFGQLQKSVFISSYNSLAIINDLAKRNEMDKYLRTMIVEKIDNDKELIEKAWNWERLKNSLEKFIKKCQNFQRLKKQSLVKKKELEIELAKILKSDPSLPNKFIPADFFKSKKQALAIYQSL